MRASLKRYKAKSKKKRKEGRKKEKGRKERRREGGGRKKKDREREKGGREGINHACLWFYTEKNFKFNFKLHSNLIIIPHIFHLSSWLSIMLLCNSFLGMILVSQLRF